MRVTTMLWDDDRDMLKSGINGLVNINREEDAYRSVIEYEFAMPDYYDLERIFGQLSPGRDNVAYWRVWQNQGSGDWRLVVTRIIDKAPTTTYVAKALLAHAPRHARGIEINPNLRLGPVLTVALFEDADGECVPGETVEVYEA